MLIKVNSDLILAAKRFFEAMADAPGLDDMVGGQWRAEGWRGEPPIPSTELRSDRIFATDLRNTYLRMIEDNISFEEAHRANGFTRAQRDFGYYEGSPAHSALSAFVSVMANLEGRRLAIGTRGVPGASSLAIYSLPALGSRIMLHLYPARDTDEVVFEVPEYRLEEAAAAPVGVNGWDVVETVATTHITIQPTEELLASIPASARSLATRIVPVEQVVGRGVALSVTGTIVATTSAGGTIGEDLSFTTADTLQRAVEVYRLSVRARMATYAASQDEAERAAQAAHRQRTQRNWVRFRGSQEPVEEELVGTLPFVPNGLSSSRRWGIEVESGGARGVDAPDGWRRVSDGSLRSAYRGYVEFQDFDPYEEEQTQRIMHYDCEHAYNHRATEEVYDDVHGYISVPNPEYLDPRECEECGEVTGMVLVEPQTIYHEEQAGDCAEFVSPILVSMHSNGLKQLTEELSKQPQNASAGVHVHVEASDLTDSQVALAVYGYDLLEPLLEASYRRERRDFCKRRDVDDVLAAARAARDGHFDADGGGRYVTLNTHSLSVHGTIEFRAMGPVYEYDYLVRWAMLCREIINIVAGGATRRDFAKVKSWEDLTSLMVRFGKEYVRAAVYEMTGETGHAAALEKSGAAVTTEALNADLARVLSDPPLIQWASGGTISQMAAWASSLSRSVTGAWNFVDDRRLVSATSTQTQV